VTGDPIFLFIETLKDSTLRQCVFRKVSTGKVHERKSSEEVIVVRREKALERKNPRKVSVTFEA
jgi:hypothetical protein